MASTIANVLLTGYFYLKMYLYDCNTSHTLFESIQRFIAHISELAATVLKT